MAPDMQLRPFKEEAPDYGMILASLFFPLISMVWVRV
jgi:hypothetical protein